MYYVTVLLPRQIKPRIESNIKSTSFFLTMPRSSQTSILLIEIEYIGIVLVTKTADGRSILGQQIQWQELSLTRMRALKRSRQGKRHGIVIFCEHFLDTYEYFNFTGLYPHLKHTSWHYSFEIDT